MIQIRNVDDEVHRRLALRASRAGMTLTDYLRRELERMASSPSVEDVLDRIDARGPIEPPESSATAVRMERDGR